MKKLTYLNLKTTDPAFNLAAEEYIFEDLPKDRTYFMLWQNDNAIIIGKYQNTIFEINEKAVKENGIKVVRRLSGGGAVYHDLGNINFTFIADAADMDKINFSFFCEPIVRCLDGIGIKAEINGRNDITIDGRKFSGNSQYIKAGRVMHHGTIMFSSNLDMVNKVLTVDDGKLESKGIKSVRSRVTNISEYLNLPISIEQFKEILIREITKDLDSEEYIFNEKEIAEIEKLKKDRYDTWEWNYGRSPECTYMRKKRIPGVGKIEAYISSDRGIIKSVEFKGDFFSASDPKELAEILKEKKAEREEIEKTVSGIDLSTYFKGIEKEDFINLITVQ